MNQQQYLLGHKQEEIVQDDDDYRFVFTVNTGATSSSNKISAIPFDLNTDGVKQYGVTLTVDWGDGNTQTLTNADYTSTNATASMHTYSTVGTYQIKVDCNDWSKCYFCSSGGTDTSTVQTGSNDITPSNTSNRNKHLAYWKQTLISVDSSIKNIPGILEYTKVAPGANDANFINNSAHCIFYKCKKLVNVTPKVFMHLTSFTSFFSAFENVDSLVVIPTGLFAYNTAVTAFNRCFYQMANLEVVPSSLFQNCPNALDFTYLFCRSPKLVRIPKGIFDYNINAKIFTDIFHKCSALTEIPEDMFKYNTAATAFQSAFRDTNIDIIPYGLFDGCSNVTTFQQCFNACKNLKSIPKDIFINCNKVENMSNCFSSCTSLKTLDADVFKGLTNVTNFANVFTSCTGLTSLPDSIFQYSNKVTTFNAAFQSCSNITNVPTSILLGKNDVTNVGNCFASCNKIGNVEIHITSKKISNCSTFIPKRTGYTRTIYVPNNSTTKTKFDAVASTLGLTVIGE